MRLEVGRAKDGEVDLEGDAANSEVVRDGRHDLRTHGAGVEWLVFGGFGARNGEQDSFDGAVGDGVLAECRESIVGSVLCRVVRGGV